MNVIAFYATDLTPISLDLISVYAFDSAPSQCRKNTISQALRNLLYHPTFTSITSRFKRGHFKPAHREPKDKNI